MLVGQFVNIGNCVPVVVPFRTLSVALAKVHFDIFSIILLDIFRNAVFFLNQERNIRMLIYTSIEDSDFSFELDSQR